MSGEVRSIVPTEVRIQDVITLTARLAQILAEEVDLLTEMKIPKIEALQQEKLFLTNALEAQRKQLEKHPHMRETIPSADKEDLRRVMDVFNDILEENQHKLLLAKEVNYKIVQAITDVVRTSTRSNVYDGRGTSGFAPYETLSVTLNKRI